VFSSLQHIKLVILTAELLGLEIATVASKV